MESNIEVATPILERSKKASSLCEGKGSGEEGM